MTGSTVQPTPRRTISARTSGWWDSATTSKGAPRARRASAMIARVREPAGKVTHGPHAGRRAHAHALRGVDRQRLVPQRGDRQPGVGARGRRTRPGPGRPGPAGRAPRPTGRPSAAARPRAAPGGRPAAARRSGRPRRRRSARPAGTRPARCGGPRPSGPAPRCRPAPARRSARPRSAWSASTRPRPAGSNRATPTRRSSSARPWESAEGDTPTAAAARAKVGSRAAATRYSSCWTVTLGRTGDRSPPDPN